MHDLDRRRHVFAEPRRQGAEMVAGLVLVDLLVAAGGGGGLFTRAGIEAQRPVERVVAILQLEEDLVGLLLVLEVGRVERLQEIEIEVACGLRGRALVRSAEEQVPASARAPFPPLDLVLPNAIAGDVGRGIRVFEDHAPQRVEVVAIQLRVAEGLGSLLDEGVEIDILLQVEEVLAVFLVEAEELAAHRPQQLLQHRLDQRAEEAGVLFGNGQHQAEIVSQLLRRRSNRRVDVGRRQAVDRQRVHDPDRRRLVLRAGESLLDARVENAAAIDDLLDGGIGSE